jgi:hypothetical protein
LTLRRREEPARIARPGNASDDGSRRETLTLNLRMENEMMTPIVRALTVFVVALSFSAGILGSTAEAGSGEIEVFAPKSGDVAGVQNRAFLVDMVARFDGDLASTGAVPGVKAAGGIGANPSFPGLVVLLSTTTLGAQASQNLANLFNIVAVSDRDGTEKTDIWTTWFVAAPKFGTGRSRLFVAVVEGNAPSVIPDMDGNGVIDEKDLKLMGLTVLSKRKVDFVINDRP